jgi:hypothetical protein
MPKNLGWHGGLSFVNLRGASIQRIRMKHTLVLQDLEHVFVIMYRLVCVNTNNGRENFFI